MGNRVGQVGKFVAGLVTLILLTLGINLAISLKLIFPESVIEWVSASSKPILSLWVISVLIASVVIILIKVGVKLPFLQPWIEIPDHPLFSYLLGLPLWAASFILIFAGIGLVFLQPICQSPTAIVDVTSLGDEAPIKYDGQSITAKAGTKLSLKATPGDNAVTFCSWSSKGSAINTMGPKSSCTTQLHLSNEPGREVITLTLSKSFCSVRSTIPLELIVEP